MAEARDPGRRPGRAKPSPDRNAFLAAILKEPDDDTPRLVYADWLQERGEAERAEFIRVQCRLPHLPPKSAEAKALKAREAELRKQLFGHLDELPLKITYRRGFVGTVTAGLTALYHNIDKLRADDAPAYELVVLHWEEEEVDEDETEFVHEQVAASHVFGHKAARRCVSIDLPCLGLEMGRDFFENQWKNLRRLNFPNNEAGPEINFVASPRFANLRWANFNNSDSARDYPEIHYLADSPHLANLEYLDFGSCNVTGDLEAVASAEHWNRLRYLNLAQNHFTAGSVAEFFATQHLPALAELDLSSSFGGYHTSGGDYVGRGDSGQGDPYADAIADSPLFARLSKLWLKGNGITDAGAKALAASPRELELELLDLSGNPIGAAGKRALQKRFGPGVCVFGGKD